MADDEDFGIMIMVRCKSQEEAVRVMEAFSRPIVGLVLEGISVMTMRMDNEQ